MRQITLISNFGIKQVPLAAFVKEVSERLGVAEQEIYTYMLEIEMANLPLSPIEIDGYRWIPYCG